MYWAVVFDVLACAVEKVAIENEDREGCAAAMMIEAVAAGVAATVDVEVEAGVLLRGDSTMDEHESGSFWPFARTIDPSAIPLHIPDSDSK